MQPIVFDTVKRKEVPVTLEGTQYILRQASGDVAARYRNMVTKCTKLRDGKVSGLEGVGDVEPQLVAWCLFRQTDNGEQCVPLQEVRSWNEEVVRTLFDVAKDISNLGEKEDIDEEIKKLQEKKQRKEALSTPKN